MTTPDIATLTAPERLGAGDLMRQLERQLAASRVVELYGAQGSLGPAHRGAAGLGRRGAPAPLIYLVADEDTAEARAGDLAFFLPPAARHRRPGRAAGRGAPAGAGCVALRRDAAGSALDPAAHGGAVSPVAGVRAGGDGGVGVGAVPARDAGRPVRGAVSGLAVRNDDRPRRRPSRSCWPPATRARRSSRTRARSRCAAR